MSQHFKHFAATRSLVIVAMVCAAGFVCTSQTFAQNNNVASDRVPADSMVADRSQPLRVAPAVAVRTSDGKVAVDNVAWRGRYYGRPYGAYYGSPRGRYYGARSYYGNPYPYGGYGAGYRGGYYGTPRVGYYDGYYRGGAVRVGPMRYRW